MEPQDNEIFNKAAELVRNNPADFQETIQSIIQKILLGKPPTIKRISCRFRVLFPRCIGKGVIVIAWLLSDTAIGEGSPSVPMDIARILTKRLNTGPNPANPQEWLRSFIFYEDESKQRLKDAVRAYETECPLNDKSVSDATSKQSTGQSGENKKIILTENQRKILNYLDKEKIAVAMVDIETGTLLSKNTVSGEVAILKQHGYVAPPTGKKRRVGITQKGIDCLNISQYTNSKTTP